MKRAHNENYQRIDFFEAIVYDNGSCFYSFLQPAYGEARRNGMVTVAKAVFWGIFFPFLVPVAFVHLIVAGVVMFAKKVLGNSKPIFKGITYTVAFLLFGVTVARRWEKKLEYTRDAGMARILATLYLITSVLAYLSISVGLEGGNFSRQWDRNDSSLILLGVITTNVLSIFYEIGRWYWNSVLKKNSGENVLKQPKAEETKREEPAPVKVEVKPTTPKQDDDDGDDTFDTFMRLLNQIEAILNSDSFEETIKAFLEEIEKLLGNGGLTSKQANHLKQFIDNAKANKAGLARV